jgi:hypothetical protein
MTILTVGTGTGYEFATIAAAVAASQAGDVIQVQAGTYTNDFPVTITHDLTIEGVGGMVNMVATGTDPSQPDLTLPTNNLKGILVIGSGPGNEPTVTLENMSFSGASVPAGDGGNGAGIRYQSGNLTLENTYFYDNQEGLLAGADSAGTITILNSEFDNNGNPSPPGSGLEHNLYVGQIASLVIDNSYFLDPVYGNNIKSRAANTLIENSRIVNPTGTGNYAIDAPNGGNLTLTNNVIEQGPNGGNDNLIAYGEEGVAYASNSITITGNVIENDMGNGQVLLNPTSVAATITGNSIYGTYDGASNGPIGTFAGNTFLPATDEPALDTSQPFLPVADIPCFAAGTRIMTERGEIAVERLAAGDRVLTAEGAARPIRWIGHRKINLARHPRPEQVRPILVRAHAVADGVPHRDLRVSPDHALLFDGILILARLLVNGASIERDVHCRYVIYYHIELETHDILLAEGMPAESYLDTGNRGMFENAGFPLILHPGSDDGQRQRIAGSVRPLVDAPATVEPIWRRLADRVALMGLSLPQAIATTGDPDLHIVTGGRRIEPVYADKGHYCFVLPHVDGPLRVVSRSLRPCEARPWIEDRRRLGVAVSRLELKDCSCVEPIPLDHPLLFAKGWWDVEQDRATMWRWTDGDAVILLPAARSAVLEITLASSLDYPIGRDVASRDGRQQLSAAPARG